MRIRIRLDRPFALIPQVGDLIHVSRGPQVGHYKVMERQHSTVGWDAINDQLAIDAVELELERYPA